MIDRLGSLTNRFITAAAVAVIVMGLMFGTKADAADADRIAPLLILLLNGEEGSSGISYPVVDTGQSACYGNMRSIDCPLSGRDFYGQDAQYQGNQFSFQNNDDGTVSDLVTGLMWRNTTDLTGDGTIDVNDKLNYSEAQSYCQDLSLADRDDWRLPTIKELYSLIDHSGTDVSAVTGTDTSNLIPFINTEYFEFGYGDVNAGERLIDAQYASDTLYAADDQQLFGVNFADGRIKGYGLALFGGEKTFYVQCVRGDAYGENDFADNGDQTITDRATGLMWAQNDSGQGFNWQEALAWAQQKNDENYLGYADWRLPDIKELQSILDYNRSPDSTGSAAINPVFNITAITNEGGQTDYPYFWSGTSHVDHTGNAQSGNYMCFGRGLGYMNNAWTDVHGAGAQRADPKQGDPNSYPFGHGPQGDAVRIYNYVRLVRDN